MMHLTVAFLLLLFHNSDAEPFEPIFDNAENVKSKVTVISGHWVVQSTKTKHPLGYYQKWWEKSMVLNCPYLVFGQDIDVITQLQAIRQKHSLPTMYAYRNLTRDMYPRFEKFQSNWIAADIPSKQVAVIWLDKIFMIQEAIRLNPFQSEWFAWNDAGNAAFRKPGPVNPPLDPLIPWPNQVALAALPRDKFIYTLSWIPWNKHYIAGTAFMYHKNIQDILGDRFMTAFHACLKMGAGWNKNICGSDQVILSHIRNKHADMFYQIGYGYGHLINRMFLDHDPVSNVTDFKDLCYEQNGQVPLLKSWNSVSVNNVCAEAWGIEVMPVPAPVAKKQKKKKKKVKKAMEDE